MKTLKAYREYMSEEADMQTMLFRYLIVTGAAGMKLPDDIKIENVLSKETWKKISMESYSEQNDRLLTLFGMGAVDEETVKDVILHNKADWLNDVITWENRVMSADSTLDPDYFDKLKDYFLVSANSAKYDEISYISFEQTEKLCENPHISIYNGYIHCDSEIMDFLHSIGKSFGYPSENKDSVYTESDSNVGDLCQKLRRPGDATPPENIPFPLDYSFIFYTISVMDKPYGKEFIRYAADNNIPTDESFEESFEKYLTDIKLTYHFKGSLRKRKICDSPNWFDYAQITNDSITNLGELSADEAYSMSITLSADDELSDSELREQARKKYMSKCTAAEDMIVEVIHDTENKLYIIQHDRFVPVDSRSYHEQLFDFDLIWSVIRECSEKRQIKKAGNEIYLPDEYYNRIPANQQGYANRLLNEQYNILLSRRKRSGIMQTLSSLKSMAAEKVKKSENNNNLSASVRPAVDLNKNNNGGKSE
ncbi:MAG: hypothetical protein ACI4K7_10565 [Oscillospiraceae bacterium]